MDVEQYDFESEVTTGLEQQIRKVIAEQYWNKLLKFINDSGGSIRIGTAKNSKDNFMNDMFHTQNEVMINHCADKIMDELLKFEDAQDIINEMVKKAKTHARGARFMSLKRGIRNVFKGEPDGPKTEDTKCPKSDDVN